MEMNINRAGEREIFTPYITKNGVRIYRKNGGMFHFWVKAATKIDNAPKQMSMFEDVK